MPLYKVSATVRFTYDIQIRRPTEQEAIDDIEAMPQFRARRYFGYRGDIKTVLSSTVQAIVEDEPGP